MITGKEVQRIHGERGFFSRLEQIKSILTIE